MNRHRLYGGNVADLQEAAEGSRQPIELLAMDATDALFVSCRPSNAPPLKVTDTPMRSKAYLDSARRKGWSARTVPRSSTSITGKLSKNEGMRRGYSRCPVRVRKIGCPSQPMLMPSPLFIAPTRNRPPLAGLFVERQDIWYIKPTVFAFHRRLRTGSLNNRLGASDV